METFPVEGDPIPKGYNGWIIFMDELSSAPRTIQAAAYKPILDRLIGTNPLHEKALVIAAGNKASDNAVAEDMSTALQSRMIHLELESNVDEWMLWAYQNGIDQRITDYIKFRPDHLYNFRPDHTDHTFACNRTWEFAHKLIKDDPLTDHGLALPLLAGAISEGVASEFLTYLEIYKDAPTKETILRDPEKTPVPSEPGIMYAITGMLAAYADEASMENLIIYMNRLPIEFQVVTIKEIQMRKPDLYSKSTHINNWVFTNCKEIF